MKQKKNCANCIKGTSMGVNDDILCRVKGVVSSDYVCFGHRPMPLPKTIKETSNKCVNCENFIFNMVNTKDSSITGLCQLFSVRQYNGTQRNACSKFVRRSNEEVS